MERFRVMQELINDPLDALEQSIVLKPEICGSNQVGDGPENRTLTGVLSPEHPRANW